MPEATLDRPRLADELRFIRNWFERPLLTGAVSPSGRALARRMARYVDPVAPGQVLELGPGTGPVTAALVGRGVPPERLCLVEYNPDFVPLLVERYPGVRVLHGDAYRVRDVTAGAFDRPLAAVVSSLPLLTRPLAERVRLIEDCLDLAAPGGPFVQFTYGLAPPVPPVALAGCTVVGSPRVWWNMPPARVWVYRRD
ncbi:MAG TPA: phospholipid methyltransferase [Hyphomicrobiales bacterium]|nr:phospholipid methyltransferase [Hyphomicrobiales bacterium]